MLSNIKDILHKKIYVRAASNVPRDTTMRNADNLSGILGTTFSLCADY